VGRHSDCFSVGTKVCRYNWHSAGSPGWPFPVLKTNTFFQIKYTEAILSNNFIKRHNKFIFKTPISILVISNHNSFRVPFDKIAFVHFLWKKHLYFRLGNDQPRKPALCQLYRHTFVPYFCLSAYMSQETRIQTSPNLSVHVAVSRSSSGSVMYFRFCGWRHGFA